MGSGRITTAKTSRFAPHRVQRSTSTSKHRFNSCAHESLGRRGSGDSVHRRPGPAAPPGTTSGRQAALGAKTPWYLI